MENKLFDVKRGGLKTNKGDEGGWTVDGTEGASSTRPDKHMGDKDEQDHHEDEYYVDGDRKRTCHQVR